MAVVKFSQNGLSISGGGNPHPVGNKRGNVTWSRDSARRTTIPAVDHPGRSDGDGFALTLTLRDIPPTDADWHRIHQAFLRTVRNTPGFLRCHWLMELQRRGAPHLHMAVYFDPCADNAHYVRWRTCVDRPVPLTESLHSCNSRLRVQAGNRRFTRRGGHFSRMHGHGADQGVDGSRRDVGRNHRD